VFASVATDRNVLARDLLWVRHLPALEFPAHTALWNLCRVRLRNRSQRCAVYVSMAGERLYSQEESGTERAKSSMRLAMRSRPLESTCSPAVVSRGRLLKWRRQAIVNRHQLVTSGHYFDIAVAARYWVLNHDRLCAEGSVRVINPEHFI